MTSQQYQYNFPTRTLYGKHSARQIPATCKELKISPAFIVTDSGILQQKFFQEILENIKQANIPFYIYAQNWGNPVKSQVEKGSLLYKESHCEGIVAIGGGASLDMAKAIAVLIHHDGDLFDYEDDKPGAKPITHQVPPIITIPTTAGTGSEVGRSTVISDDNTKQKKIIFSPFLMPKTVILDPITTVHLPQSITASTGMDALTHLIESYLAIGFQPLCDAIALHGIRLVNESLVLCSEYSNAPNDNDNNQIEARGMMLNASYMGAVAFQKGLGVTHSCAHALSTIHNVHHGLANGILLPYTMQFNLEAAKNKFCDLAKIVNFSEVSPESFIHWIITLKKKLHIPDNLGMIGISKDTIPQLVEIAVKDPCHGSNPKPVAKKDFIHIFERAFGDA